MVFKHSCINSQLGFSKFPVKICHGQEANCIQGNDLNSKKAPFCMEGGRE